MEKDIDLQKYLQSSPQGNFFLLAGPCAIEDEILAMEIAYWLKTACAPLGIPFVFKGSYRKANRTRLDSFKGIGDIMALEILAKVREELEIPVMTDIHEAAEAAIAAEYVDMLQIPAFLCRQTDLIVAAAKTGKMVNIKKGQFLAPQAMKFAVEKVRKSGGRQVCITERGTTFGYQDLVVDFRGIPVMQKECDCPVVMDLTHSLQQPNQPSGVTGGLPGLISTMGRAAIAVGADGIFIETHPHPEEAKSDGANMLPLPQVPELLDKLVTLRQAYNEISK